MVTNVDKCPLITSTSEEVSIKIENEIIKNSLQEKRLGIVIDNRIIFEPHMKNLCKKEGQKLHALARIANYMDISNKTQHYECTYSFTIVILPVDMDVSQ